MFRNNWSVNSIFFRQRNKQDWYFSDMKEICDVINFYRTKYLYFVGHSAGGSAALMYGSVFNNVKGILSFSPQSTTLESDNSNAPWLKTIIDNNVPYLNFFNMLKQNHVIVYDRKNLKEFDKIHLNNFESVNSNICNYTVLNSEFTHRIPWDLRERGITRLFFSSVFKILNK